MSTYAAGEKDSTLGALGGEKHGSFELFSCPKCGYVEKKVVRAIYIS
jgi:hypothetical protein